MKWVVDDSGRVAALESHPVARWASAFDPPLRAILELGFICIEEHSDQLILALHTARIRPAALAGTFYFLAEQRVDRVIIDLDCGTKRARLVRVDHVADVYKLLGQLTASAPTDASSIAMSLEGKAEITALDAPAPN